MDEHWELYPKSEWQLCLLLSQFYIPQFLILTFIFFKEIKGMWISLQVNDVLLLFVSN